MHSYIVVSGIISIIYTIAKFALKKEFTTPDMKESGLLYVSSILGLYLFDTYFNVTVSPKISEVFTDPPSF